MARNLVGQILHRTYRVERLIGEGAMGSVYEASHLRLPRRFAIKVLQSAARDGSALDRFWREAQLISSLGHPHIVEVIDFDRMDDDTPFIVMELLGGETLAARLGRGPLSLPQAASVLRQATSALAAIHAQRIVHRDLKPHNIFLCRRGQRDDLVKLLDFGISKLLGVPSATHSDALIGTPAYMSPEQAEQQTKEIDERSDIYSLGCVVFEMLAGRPPFLAPSVISLLLQIVNSPPPALHELRPELPPSITEVVNVALRKDRAERYPTVGELWRAFALALARLGVSFQEPIDDGQARWMLVEPTQPPVLPPAQQTTVGPLAGTTFSGSVGEQAPRLAGPRSRWRWVASAAVIVVAVAGVAVWSLTPRVQPPLLAAGSGSGSAGRIAPPRPDVSPPPPRDAVVAVAPAPDVRSRAPIPKRVKGVIKRVRATTVELGKLTVVVSRGAATMSCPVLVDGHFFDNAPFYSRPLSAGRHTVVIRPPGRPPVSRTIDVKPGETLPLPVPLE